MDTVARVQDCGCIALPPEVQAQTGLYPGATFRVEVTPDKRMLVIPIEIANPSEPDAGAACG